jgi:hypothetical protein
MTDAVAQPSKEYEYMYPHWLMVATLREGTKAMRDAGKEYLPQESDEAPAAYENRLRRSVLTNLYKKTADKLISKPLKKPIIVEEDVPVEIRPYLEDIDSLGTRLDVFAKEILTQAVDDGLTHILTEFPNSNEVAAEIGEFVNEDGTRSLSLAQAEAMNIRPYARHVKASDLIGWQWEIIDGKKTLTQIRIFEVGRVPSEKNEFEQEMRSRVRVIERDAWFLYEEQERKEVSQGQQKTEWVIIEQGANTLGEIALTTLYTNQTGFMKGRPWLEDIAYLNVAHWQSDSDQRNLLHIARVPILFAKGFGDEDTQFELSIGSNSFLRGPSSADLKYVEHSGQGIEAGRNDLKDIEERIQLLGMETMMKKPSGNTTATEKAIDSADANSALGMVSQELENALEEMLDYFAKWMELGDTGGSLTVFKDFGIEVADSSDIEILLKAKMQGEISQVTFLKELKRRGLLADDFDPQTEIDLLDIESAGSASLIEEPEIDPLTGEETGEPKEVPGRNAVGDVTAEEGGHRHTLEENGVMSTEIGEDGMSHTHTWDEFAIRTSVDDGHSHILLTRSAATKGAAPDIPPPGADDGASESEGGNSFPSGDNDDEDE